MKPTYISPSSLSLFYKDPIEYYVKYYGGAPRMPQTEPMSVGSSFDAFVKARLICDLDPSLNYDDVFTCLFESQVDESLRDFALAAGRRCMKGYVDLGQYAYIVTEMDLATESASFEGKIDELVCVSGEAVPFLGYPDLYFLTSHGAVVLDWKVNGYCSRSGVSPAKGYVRSVKQLGKVAVHKDSSPTVGFGGLLYDSNACLESSQWSAQLCIYSWALKYKHGLDPMSRSLLGIDQLAWRQGSKTPLNIATHRAIFSDAMQAELWGRCVVMWNAIESGHLFINMSRSDSDAECARLDALAAKCSENSILNTFLRSWN